MVSSTSELDVPGRGFVKQTTTTNEYTTTSRNIQLVTRSVQRDDVAETEDQTINIPTEDGRAVASTTTFFLPGTSQRLRPWTKHSYEYDAQGRTAVDTLAWAPDASIPDGSVSTVTNKMAYAFNNGTLTQTAYDSDNNATMIKYDMQKYAGPMMSKTLPLGQKETFEYDNICRLVKHTDALGHITTNTYTTGPSGGSESIKSPMGYVKLTTFDILGRESKVFDNGDPTQPTLSDPTRLLSRQSYDFLSQVSESVDRFGLVFKYTFDALSRPLSVTDPKQNVQSYQYDDVNITITQRLNGDIRSVIQLNGRTDTIKVMNYPDSDDTSINYVIETNTAFDGNKRPFKTTTVQRPKSSGDETILETVDVVYGPQSLVASRQVAGSTNKDKDTVKRQFTYDVFGNTYTWLKNTKYADGRAYEVKGPVSIYDKNDRIAVTTNQLGQKERNHYDANGWLSRTVRYDGSEVLYTCDAVGQFIKATYPSSTTEFTYSSDGRVIQVKDGGDIIKYQSTLDGTFAKTTYTDGLSQINGLDKYSRLVTQTDVFGVARTTRYGSSGEITSRSCKQDTVEYQYGTVNHSNGQCVGLNLAGGRPYVSKFTYDGFDRLKKTTVTGSNGDTILDTTYTLDGKSKVTKTVTRSTTAPDLNIDRDFTYDGLGQVTYDSHPSAGPVQTTYTYDGNSNILSTRVADQTTTMTYNAIDQRTDSGFKYDTLGRMVSDNAGHGYKFDDRDRLVSVQTTGATSGFEYRADDYLARRSGPTDTAEMYYNSGKINSMTVAKSGEQGSKTSLFSGPGAIISSYADEKAPDYFFQSLNSTSLLTSEDRSTSITYDAYGTEKSSSPVDTRSSFGFQQQFTDQTSGLVYLRSRYYSPKIMSFISMDRNHQENRYAYCEGDPVNSYDPLGQSWEKVLGITAIVVGAVVGAIATAGVGAALEFGLGAAVGAFGLSEAAAATASAVIGVTSAAIAGAAGNVVGGLVTASITGEKYGWGNVLVDSLTGAAGGAAGKLIEPAAKTYAAGFKYGARTLTPYAQELLVSGITGAVNSGTQAFVRPILMGEPVDPLSVGVAMIKGFGTGVAGKIFTTYAMTKAKAQWEEKSPLVRATARQFMARVRGKAQAAKMSDIDVYYDSAADLVTFRSSSGTSSALEADVSNLANSSVRSRLGTLREEHEDFPVLITEL